jgi:5-methylcytosine-specific restriction endonuclease McrA
MKRDHQVPETPKKLAEYPRDLRTEREQRKANEMAFGKKRRSLTSEERDQVYRKTDGRCHICGGEIEGQWEADHVLAHSGGGGHDIDNYLPAHRICNNYRWDYLPVELEEILRLGVWVRTQIERESKVGKMAAEQFIKHEQGRIRRREKKG